MELTFEDRRLAYTWVSELSCWCQSWLFEPVRRATGGLLPAELTGLVDLFPAVAGQLAQNFDESFQISEAQLPFFKRLFLFKKGDIARQQAESRVRTHHADIRSKIDALSNDVNRLFANPELQAIQPLRIPFITEFLSLQDAYVQIPEKPDEIPLQFDEKFRILQSQSSFLRHLKRSRLEAWLRQYRVTVVFMDIDDFKTFNTLYGESVVDRDLLPRLMQTVEAHVHSHGWAFRFGGDEYALLLPNMPLRWAHEFVAGLQHKLAMISAPGIERAVTICAGLCCLPTDTFLTDDQALEAAVRAKKYAKSQAGKDCLATFGGDLFRDEDLYVLPKVTHSHWANHAEF